MSISTAWNFKCSRSPETKHCTSYQDTYIRFTKSASDSTFQDLGEAARRRVRPRSLTLGWGYRLVQSEELDGVTPAQTGQDPAMFVS